MTIKPLHAIFSNNLDFDIYGRYRGINGKMMPFPAREVSDTSKENNQVHFSRSLP